MPAAEEILVVLCTVPDPDAGRRLGRQMVEQRLAACANLLPGLTSLYWWENEVQEDAETLLLLKTRPDRFEALRTALAAAHPYDVPEIVALPSRACHEPYADWVRRETADPR
jgi:periplasmic divalent cation tolerance protein